MFLKKVVCQTAISRRFEKVFVAELTLTNKAVKLGQRTRSNGDGLATHYRRVAVVKARCIMPNFEDYNEETKQAIRDSFEHPEQGKRFNSLEEAFEWLNSDEDISN